MKRTKEERQLLARKWSMDGFLESGRDHTGRILDNTRLNEFIDTSILLGCAYFGARAAQRALDSPDAEAIGGGALAGMIGYKLATTFGGTPPVSQIAGLGILASIGVTDLIGNPVEAIIDALGAEAASIKKADDTAKEPACAECEALGGTCGEVIRGTGGNQRWLTCTLKDGTKRY